MGFSGGLLVVRDIKCLLFLYIFLSSQVFGLFLQIIEDIVHWINVGFSEAVKFFCCLIFGISRDKYDTLRDLLK